MRRLRLPLVASAMIVTIAACGSREPVDNKANGAGLPEPVAETAHDPTGAPSNNEAAPIAPAAAAIPAPLQGRWGLTPADCMPNRSDAKGLLTVTGGELRFYESRALPGEDVHADDDSIDGHFNFTGEGQSWSKFQSLKLSGNKLIRTETNPAASFTYAKC
jgi:hypothetical protein